MNKYWVYYDYLNYDHPFIYQSFGCLRRKRFNTFDDAKSFIKQLDLKKLRTRGPDDVSFYYLSASIKAEGKFFHIVKGRYFNEFCKYILKLK